VLVHETLFSTAPVWGGIVGVGTIRHAVPFQDSENVCWMLMPDRRTWIWPTAMQLVLLVHDTELSKSPPPGWRGAGVGRTVQALPFQRSARGKNWKLPDLISWTAPTARQSLAARQETELRLALITDSEAEALAGPAVSAARVPAASAASARGADLRSVMRWVLPVTAILP
jgi:hypothetical protein